MDNVSNYKSFILNVLITSTQMAMEKKSKWLTYTNFIVNLKQVSLKPINSNCDNN